MAARQSIAGYVEGLQGKLLLQNNDQQLSLTADGPFRFPTEEVMGTAYAVHVVEQPAGQLCAVSDGNGVLSAVSPLIRVHCGAADANGTPGLGLLLAGQVSGLCGTLELGNDQDRVHLTADGPFTFANRLAPAESFAVRVLTQPPEQDCLLQGAQGVAGLDACFVQVRCATRTYPLGGTVLGLRGTLMLRNKGADDLFLSADGSFRFATSLAAGAPYRITVAQQPSGQFCSVADGNGAMAASMGVPPSIECVLLPRLRNGQAASVVIGQVDFTTAASDYTTFDSMYGNPLVLGSTLYLPDYGDRRILGYLQVPTQSGAMPDFILGQPDPQSLGLRAVDANTFGTPQTVSSNGTLVSVTDYDNSRVLLYSAPPTRASDGASVVVGQADFISSAAGCSSTQLNKPESALLFDHWLFVADSTNNRVLIYDHIPTVSGAPADRVLGQPDMTSSAANQGLSVTTASTLSYPTDVWTDGNRLLVVDQTNSRVLLWKQMPMQNNAPADVVLGQPDMSQSTGITPPTAASLYLPYTAASDGLQIYISDTFNNRIVRYDHFPSQDGMPADRVLGQQDFTSNASGLDAVSLFLPTSLALTPAQLIVGDLRNRRYLIYNDAP